MRKPTTLSSGSTLIGIIVAILAGLNAPARSQQVDEFYTYQFHVFCKDEKTPAAIFFVRGTGTMGTSPVICVGSCGGRTVPASDAVSGLSPKVSAGFTEQYEGNERKAAAGNARSVAACIGNRDAAKCDESGACGAISKALEAIEQARTSVGSWGVRTDKLKQELPPLLDQIAASACKDDHYPLFEVYRIRTELEDTKERQTISNSNADTILNTARLDEMVRSLQNLSNAMCKGGQKGTEVLPCRKPTGDGAYQSLDPTLDTTYLGAEHKKLLPKFAWGELMPTEPCPECQWQLLSVSVERMSAKPGAAPFRFSSIWRCPSSNRVLMTQKLLK